MAYKFWQYFLAVESDLAGTARYVELAADNFTTYSVEYARILLAASSEVDVLCKRMCAVIDPSSSRGNINDYRRVITQRFPKLHSIEVLVPRFELVCHPWDKWSMGGNPDWWSSYNRVKHQRDENYRDANLRHALDSVAGLFAIVLYLHRAENIQDTLYPYPQLLDLEKSPGSLLLADTYGLPDFP